MRLLRYILSHGLLLLFIVALAFTYYYRTQLFSTDITARIDTAVEEAMSWTEIFKDKQADSQSTEQLAVSPSAVVAEEQAPSDASVVEQTAAMMESPVPETQSSDLVSADAETQTAPSPTEQVADNEALPAPEIPAQESVITTDVAMTDPQESAAQEEVVAESDQAAAATMHASLLNQARLAFEGGKPDKSISLYAELSELNPDDPNVHGELGNVYYSQGKWKQAGAAYYEAATRLLAHGQADQVQYLYRVIQGLDQESADKLKSQLGK